MRALLQTLIASAQIVLTLALLISSRLVVAKRFIAGENHSAAIELPQEDQV
jgi:hypothetical protein